MHVTDMPAEGVVTANAYVHLRDDQKIKSSLLEWPERRPECRGPRSR
jgi:hypothetical protein